jgi:cytochrome c
MGTDRTTGWASKGAGAAMVVALAASGGAWAQDRSAILAARGQDLVTRNCAACHAVGRTDTSAHVGAPAFRDLSRRYPIDNLSEALAEGLVTGHPAMPEFVFPPGDVAAIIAYLKSIQTQQVTAAPTGGPPAGR